MMQTSEQRSQTQLFSDKTKAITLKIQALFQKAFLNNKTKKLVASVVSFIEARPLWQKIVAGLVIFLPLFIIGLVLQISSLISAGICSFVFASFFISFFEYYKKQHEEDNKKHEQCVSSINEEVYQLTEELNAFAKELGHYQTLTVGEKTVFLKKITVLHGEKRQLESSLSNVTGRNKVLTEIKDSLIGENQALRTVVTEKIRVLIQKDQRINKLEQGLFASSEEKKQLLLELEKYNALEVSLREEIKILTEENKRQGIRLTTQDRQTQQLRTQLASVLGQRRYLVNKIKVKEKDIEGLILSKQNLEQELAKNVVEQERLRLVVTELQQDQEQLKLRIKGLNLKLFESHLSQEKNQQLLKTVLNAGIALQENNEFLAVQLVSLTQENKRLTLSIESLTQVEEELQNSKSKMQEVITGLQRQINEQSTLLDARKEQLEAALTDYQATRIKLDETVNDLTSVKTGMITEVDKLKQTQIILTKLISNLSKAAIKGGEDNSQFLSQLNDLLKDKERCFQQVAADALGVNQRLTAMSQGFEECILRHKHLLQTQEHYMQQFARSSDVFFAPPEPYLLPEQRFAEQPIAVF